MLFSVSPVLLLLFCTCILFLFSFQCNVIVLFLWTARAPSWPMLTAFFSYLKRYVSIKKSLILCEPCRPFILSHIEEACLSISHNQPKGIADLLVYQTEVGSVI